MDNEGSNTNLEDNTITLKNEVSNKRVEDITLEMFMNKKTLHKIRSNQLGETIMFDLDLETYKQDIEDMFLQLMNDPKTNTHPDVKEQFINFCKVTIIQIQTKEVLNANPHLDEDRTTTTKSISSEPIQSFWGKEIVTKKS